MRVLSVFGSYFACVGAQKLVRLFEHYCCYYRLAPACINHSRKSAFLIKPIRSFAMGCNILPDNAVKLLFGTSVRRQMWAGGCLVSQIPFLNCTWKTHASISSTAASVVLADAPQPPTPPPIHSGARSSTSGERRVAVGRHTRVCWS